MNRDVLIRVFAPGEGVLKLLGLSFRPAQGSVENWETWTSYSTPSRSQVKALLCALR